MSDRTASACEAEIAANLGPDVDAKWRASELGGITECLEDRLLFRFIGDPKGSDVLDIGCGDGTFAMSLRERGARIRGVDASPAMIDAAMKRAAVVQADGAMFQVGRAQRLPFDDDSFDIVVAKTILCFVKDPTDAFAEMARVLRPGGRLVIGELGRWSLWALQRHLRALFGSRLWKMGHSWTAGQLCGYATGAGLSPTDIRGAVYFPRNRIAARYLAGFDDSFSRVTTIGAAFIAMSATKNGAA